MDISIILPSRNNLKYLRWSYAAIRRHQEHHNVQVCVADDFSDDGTWEWCAEIKEKDPNFDCIRNNGPTRVGHTILYDRLVKEVAKYEICMIYHADMYLCPGALDAIEHWMYDVKPTSRKYNAWIPKYKTIVSLTRIEPPLHPPGPEKLLWDFGTEPEDFDEEAFLMKLTSPDFARVLSTYPETTEGVFAPWAFWKSEFQAIGGHDPLFAPQSKEDSDIFNRFQLNGVKFIQTWGGFVYHMTCRGSRFNPTLTTVGTNSKEWEAQNVRSARNFIRKWGHYVKHDQYMKPVIPHKYDIGIRIHNTSYELLHAVEPWVSNVYITDAELKARYLMENQKDTMYDLDAKIITIQEPANQVVITIDGKTFGQPDMNALMIVSEILDDSGVEDTSMTLGNMEFKIKKLIPIERSLIHLNK